MIEIIIIITIITITITITTMLLSRARGLPRLGTAGAGDFTTEKWGMTGMTAVI